MTDPLAPVISALRQQGRPSSDYDLNPALAPKGRALRGAAVLVAFRDGPRRAELLLTKRASHLRHHPSQIAFPGGKIDAGDDGPVACALREAREEVGLLRAEPLGLLEPHETVTGFLVTPVLARISAEFTPKIDAQEVEEAFFVPLAHLVAARFRVEERVFQGMPRYYYVAPYGPYYIWGATARILRALVDRMAHD